MTSTLDTDGDTVMSGLNGLSNSTIAAIINAINSQNNGKNKNKTNKPPASSRSEEEFSSLRAAGKCTRCAELGHWFKKCPKFTWAKKQADINAVQSLKGLKPNCKLREQNIDVTDNFSENE